MDINNSFRNLESHLALWYKNFAKEEKQSAVLYTIEYDGRRYKVAERLSNLLKGLGQSYSFFLLGDNKIKLQINT